MKILNMVGRSGVWAPNLINFKKIEYFEILSLRPSMFVGSFSTVDSSSFFLSHQTSPSYWRATRRRDWQAPMSAYS